MDEKGCKSLNLYVQSTSLSLLLKNKGFHREVETIVRFPSDIYPGFKVLLVYRWPSGIYVDPYQLSTLNEQNNWQILLDSPVDLEAPAHLTTGFITHVYPDLSQQTSPLLRVSIPIHARYHKPSTDGSTFTTVDIGPPDLLVRAELCSHFENVEPHAIFNAPCAADSSSTCQWLKIRNQQHPPEHMSLRVPVGDGLLVTPVCVGTLLVTMICCAALSKVMWTHRIC
ncbi:phosphatidylinositol-glycan biosynthesis class X protein [Neosynchiropus ocellatus]